MRKNVAVLLLAFFLLTLIPPGLANAQEDNTGPVAVYHLPAAIREIGDEAFAKTGVKAVVFRAGITHVGDKVFSGARFLTDIFIPATMEHLEDSFFPCNPRLTIHWLKNSNVADRVRERQIPFVQPNAENSTLISENATYNESRIPNNWRIRVLASEKQVNLRERGADEGKSLRPQDRPELNPIDYRFP